MAEFHKLIASLRDALERRRAPAHHDGAADAPHVVVPVAETARRAELFSAFARELEALGGRFLGTLTPAETAARIAEVAGSLKTKTAAVGEGVVNDPAPIAAALERAGIEVMRTAAVNDDQARAALRARFAQCDLAVVEAHYAIASTGTLVMVATPARPSSLTLLPPANVIIVDAARMKPDLAAALAALGADAIASHRVALVTGPSRTADIEKRIVRGVHGPRELFVAVVWHSND
ncbi:MAG TPA: LUD domain-containing protein [Candidatus Binataceae bacterium]|nr:LUD domain-containing protein [Candidatus Binataceae bacterium]